MLPTGIRSVLNLKSASELTIVSMKPAEGDRARRNMLNQGVRAYEEIGLRLEDRRGISVPGLERRE